jgi:hypothetical protein
VRLDSPWDRHAAEPEHGSPADPHLFWPSAVQAGRRAAARTHPTAFYAPCALCRETFNLGAEPQRHGTG